MKHIQILIAFLLLSVTMQAQLVVQVYDGDTYKILQKGKFQIIRLANVDAPELNQYYGKLVKSAVSNLILARIVEIEPIGKDPFKRTIAKVRIDDMPLDSLIVAKGWGWHFIQYSNWPELSNFEAIAKKAKLGMWRCPKNVPPWIWRKLNAKQKRFHEMCR